VPFTVAVFDILYGVGISRTGELLDLGVEHHIVQKSGSWYSMGETRIGQGREAARAHLVENPDVADEIEYKVREKLGLIPTKEGPPAEPAD
jgi:recombination protein RecA